MRHLQLISFLIFSEAGPSNKYSSDEEEDLPPRKGREYLLLQCRGCSLPMNTHLLILIRKYVIKMMRIMANRFGTICLCCDIISVIPNVIVMSLLSFICVNCPQTSCDVV